MEYYIFVGCIIAVVLFWLVTIYNKFVTLKNTNQNAFSQIDVQLKRRYDLIPNLIKIAKKYMEHEQETLQNVVAARNQASSALATASDGKRQAPFEIQGLAEAESLLQGAMSRLNVVMEAYPDLKANTTMRELTEELSSTENKISYSRQAYNDSVMFFNQFRQSFPAVIFASMFGFHENLSYLEFEDAVELQKAPVVEF